jgi:hypothetical protein
MRSAAVQNLKAVDTPRDGNYTIDLEFTAPGYAQIMQKRLMVFRLSSLEPVDPLPFSDPKRAYPVVINARTWRDTVTVVLPEGFEVDEIPHPRSWRRRSARMNRRAWWRRAC